MKNKFALIMLALIVLVTGCSEIAQDDKIKYCEDKDMYFYGDIQRGFSCSISDIDYTKEITIKNITSNCELINRTQELVNFCNEYSINILSINPENNISDNYKDLCIVPCNQHNRPQREAWLIKLKENTDCEMSK